MSTTLHKILQQHQLGAMFNEIVAIVQESVDTSSLLEQLSELIEPLVSADEAEQVIRTILQVLERGQESLFAQEPIQLYQKKLQSKNEDEELVDDEALDGNSPEVLLHQVFVDLSLEQIQETLKSQNYNVERAIDFLLQKDIEQAKPVCRHFIMGNCFRSDCWFSHDPKQMVCKFWIKGRCTKGNQCEFLHSVQQSPKERRPESPKKPEDTKSLGRDDFPALGSPKKQTIDLTSPSQPWSKAASQPKVESRQEKQYAQYQSQQRKVKLDSKWMSTGAAVNNTYFEFRQDALKAASERNRLYQQATQAYLSGNKAAARALSIAASKLNEQVQHLHHTAATKIFTQRNATQAEPMIDLHGLHPQEAVQFVETSIRQWQLRKYSGTITFITGTGHHSKRRAQVLPAVWEYLISIGKQPREGTLSDGQGGLLLVDI